MKPLVSVVITSYNYGHYICTAVDSVLAQDYENVEIIITDNCSTDNTLEVLERYKDDQRVRVNQNPINIGITPNINTGISLSRGEYVVILSADDWLLAGHISRLVAVAEAHPEIGFVYATAYLCNDDQAPHSVRHVLGQTLFDYTGGRDELGWLFAACYMCLPTILFRRSLFERHGMLDESFEVASDWEITVRMILAGEKTAYLAAPLVGVRIHETQASGVSRYVASGADFRERLEIIERHYTSDVFPRSHGRELRIVNGLQFHREMLRNIAPDRLTEELQIRTDRLLFRLRRDQRRRTTKRPAKIAIILTSTGRTVSLGACLQSLMRQTYQNWEVWLFQDQGFDVSAYAGTQIPHDRLHYSRSLDRLGPAVMRTQAMWVASGDYYLFLDEDTQIMPDHLERLVAAAEHGDGVGIAGTTVQFNEADGTMGWHPIGNTDGTYLLKPSANDMLVANCLPLSAVLLDAAAADALDTFDATFGICADWDFLIRLSRIRQLAYTGTRTFVEHAFTNLRGQVLAMMWPSYLDRMQAIYDRYPSNVPEVVQARERHYGAVTAVLRPGPAGYKDAQNLFRLYGVLAGAGASNAVRLSA
jgi:glycosyltransferase involved in cell wall biosynthesis